MGGWVGEWMDMQMGGWREGSILTALKIGQTHSQGAGPEAWHVTQAASLGILCLVTKKGTYMD